MVKLAKGALLAMSRKYFGHAGAAQFVDAPKLRAAGMDREADLCKQIHDLSYKLASALEDRAN
jgi:hypothetical protein